jgi:PII-like signaling protein
VSADCLKLTTYFGERDRADGRFVADALLDLYARHGLQTSILLRGAGGFGFEHHLRTDRQLSLSEDLPLVSVAVDARERIEALLPEVTALKRRGLLTLERARLLSGELAGPPPDEQAKLTLYLGRGERVGGRPAHQAVCELLHRRGLAGASVLLGVDGTARGSRRRARFLARNAGVPLMVVSVGPGASIAAVLGELEQLLPAPLATLERVHVCKRDGVLLARPHALPGTDEHGLALWQKLTVYGGEARETELLRRLRGSGARGATVLRGIWGFHGEHPPHGDRLLQLRRRVPVVTIVLDRPERIARAFDAVDELTVQGGLVTSETVPALADVAGERPPRLRLARTMRAG